MAEPITIGGQTFIKTQDGWVDKKSKIRAPEGLTSLLEKMQSEGVEEEKKKRVKIDSSREPVLFGGTEYAWDLNSQIWIDKKAKIPANPRFSAMIESVYQSALEGSTDAKEKTAETVISNMGTAGKVAKQRAKQSGVGSLPASNIKINSPLVAMIEKLATIDGYLKQRLDNQKKIADRSLAMAKEVAIEAEPLDATPVGTETKKDAEKSDASSIATALLVGGLIAAQFEPVQEAFKSLAGGIKSMWNFVGKVATTISDGLDFFTGGSTTASSKAPAPSSGNSSEANKLEPSASNETIPSESSEPSQPNQTAPSDATPVQTSDASTSSATPEPSAPNEGGSTAVGRTIIGAAIGGSIAGPVGAVIGGAIGYMSSPSSSSAPSATPSSSGSGSSEPDAQPTQQTGQQPSATPNTGNVKPSDVIAFTGNSGDESHFNKLEPETKKAVLNAAVEYKQQTGQKLKLNSGRRTYGEQQALWNSRASNPNPVARPGTSKHESGYAVDIGQRGDPTARKILEKHGMVWYGNKDPVHYTLKGHGDSGGGGGSYEGGEEKGGIVTAAAGALWDLGSSAMSAIADIVGAGLGDMKSRSITDSLMASDPVTAREISSAAVQKTSAVVESKKASKSEEVKVPKDPLNINPDKQSPVVENLPTKSDYAGVEFYLTRMGFPKIEYSTPSPSTKVA